MRLIDAEAKINMLLYDEEHEEQIAREMTVKEALDLYTEDGCPTTIDAEPVKHGKWLMNDVYGAYCSECGSAAFEITGSQYSRMKTRYCWQCGAKMDEEDTP